MIGVSTFPFMEKQSGIPILTIVESLVYVDRALLVLRETNRHGALLGVRASIQQGSSQIGVRVTITTSLFLRSFQGPKVKLSSYSSI